MATADLSRRVEKVVGYPPLAELGDLQRREFHKALLEAASFQDLPGKWQAAILKAEQNEPKLRLAAGNGGFVEVSPGRPRKRTARPPLPKTGTSNGLT